MAPHQLIRKQLSQVAASCKDWKPPRDLYSGVRPPVLPVPDNLLMFVRRNEQELKDGSMRSHYHHRWVLLVPLRGQGSIHIDGSQFRLEPGDYLLMPPLRLHHYSRIPEAGVCWLFITFDLPTAITPPRFGQLPAEGTKIVAQLVALWGKEDDCSTARCSAECALLLQQLLPSKVRPKRDDLLPRIQHWLEKRGGTPFQIGDLAAALGISASHLRASFRARTGRSLGRYLTEACCRRAALLLAAGSHTVTAAAEQSGFGSVYAFSRTFRSVMGVTPSVLVPNKPKT